MGSRAGNPRAFFAPAGAWGDVPDRCQVAAGFHRCVIGARWVHLRLCRTCGHVGCCDDSPNRHATKHFHATGHPIIEGYDPPEGWGWCYLDEMIFDLSDRATPQDGPIPRIIDSLVNENAIVILHPTEGPPFAD
jgi:hypothetical protein